MAKIIFKLLKPVIMPLAKKVGIKVAKKLVVVLLVCVAIVGLKIAFDKIYKNLNAKVPFLFK